MRRTPYCHDRDSICRHYQYGGSLPYFRGHAIQRGYGLGSVISGLFRNVVPLVKKVVLPGAKALFKKAAPHAAAAGVEAAIKGIAQKRKRDNAKVKRLVADTIAHIPLPLFNMGKRFAAKKKVAEMSLNRKRKAPKAGVPVKRKKTRKKDIFD